MQAASVAALAAPIVHESQPGIKLCAQAPATPSDNDLLFLQQIGAGYVRVASTPSLRTAEGFRQIKKCYADARHHSVEHREYQRPQHAGGYVEPARQG